MKPEQRKLTSEKLTDKEWQKTTANFYRSIAIPFLDVAEGNLLYKAAVGNILESDYYHTISGLTDNQELFKSYPSKIRNFPIIPRALMALMGEKSERPIIAIVAALNSNLPNKQREYEYNEIIKSVQQQYLLELQKQGVDIETMTDSQGNPIPPKPIEQIKLESSNLTDEMADMGQDFLDMANSMWDIPAKFRDGFLHFLITGKIVTYKDVRNDELQYDICPAVQIYVVASRNITYLEDAECVRRIYSIPLSELGDMFSENKEYEDEIREELESFVNVGTTRGNYHPSQIGYWTNNDLSNTANSTYSSNNSALTNEVIIEHLTFKSETKIGRLTTPTGEVIEVDDSYEPTEFDDIEWKWVDERWEGYVIADRFYLGFQPLPLQRGKFTNPFAGKLPYNGRIYGNIYAPFQSVVKQLLPYQILRNIIKFHIEKLINKNKDKITVLPIGILPNDKEKGITPFTAMYNADSTGFLLVDESNPNFAQALQSLKVLDASLNDIILRLHEYDRAIVAEADELIGLTPQRMGQGITSSSGLGTTQEAIYRGSVLTEELFKEYDEFQTREYQGMLDLSPFIFTEGKAVSYLTSDFQRKYREFYGFDMQQIQFAVKVKDSKQEMKKLETMRQTAFSMAQNGQMPSMVGKIIDSNNFSRILKDIKEMEDELEQKQQASAKAEQDMKAEEMNLEANIHQDEMDFKYYEVDTKNLTERLKTINEQETTIVNSTPDGQDNIEVLGKLSLEKQKIQAELYKHNTELQERIADRKSKEKIEKEKNETALKVAKSNKNRYDKK